MPNSIKMFKDYNFNHLKDDLITGLSVVTLGLSQTIAYIMIAVLNPAYGLYNFMVSKITDISSYIIVR